MANDCASAGRVQPDASTRALKLSFDVPGDQDFAGQGRKDAGSRAGTLSAGVQRIEVGALARSRFPAYCTRVWREVYREPTVYRRLRPN